MLRNYRYIVMFLQCIILCTFLNGQSYLSYIDAERDARLGVPQAQYELAQMYFEGTAVDRNINLGREWLNRAIRSNNIDAMALRGDMFWFGSYGERQNTEEALKWYRDASTGGNSIASLKLGLIYSLGINIERDRNQASNFLNRAADANKAEINALIGIMAVNNIGVGVDRSGGRDYLINANRLGNDLGTFFLAKELEGENIFEAVKLYEILALKQEGPRYNNLEYIFKLLESDKNYDLERLLEKLKKHVIIEAKYNYGKALVEGVGNKVNERYGVELLKRSANRGYKDAILELGMIYVTSPELIVTDERTEAWIDNLKLMGDNGDALAAAVLAKMFAEGTLVNRDTREVQRWGAKGIQGQDNQDRAKYVLAVMSMEGVGFEKNERRAYELLSSIDSDFIEKNLMLGRMYFEGIGTNKDYRVAYDIFNNIRGSENQQVLFNLAYMYENGLGVGMNSREALRLYYELANRDHALSAYKIATFLEQGGVLPADPREAMNWYQRAGLLGHVPSQIKVSEWYEAGIGVRRDIIRSLGWLILANQMEKNESIERELQSKQSQMDTRDVLRARGLARDMARRIEERRKGL